MLSPTQQCWVMALHWILWCGVGWVDDPRDARVERSSLAVAVNGKSGKQLCCAPRMSYFQLWALGANAAVVTLWWDISRGFSLLKTPPGTLRPVLGRTCDGEREVCPSPGAESPGASGGRAFQGECPAFPAVRTSGQWAPPASPGQLCAHLGRVSVVQGRWRGCQGTGPARALCPSPERPRQGFILKML